MTYYPDIYPFAARLAEYTGSTHIVGLGFGDAREFVRLYPAFEIIGIDSAEHIHFCKQAYPYGTWLEYDSEKSQAPQIPLDTLRHSIIICSNLHERPVDASQHLKILRSWMKHSPICLWLSPESDCVGLLNVSSDGHDPSRARKWSLQGLQKLLSSSGLNPVFLGLTTSDDRDREKRTPLAILESTNPKIRPLSASQAPPTPATFRVVALMCVYNEADVIVPSINHLIDQGIELYLLDNCSTDDTYDLALNFKGRGLLGIERFPSQGPSHYFDLRRLLQRKEELATQITADWFIHHDADEIRSSPWSGISLKDGIYRVDQAGYNCIDHTVLSFPPLDNDYPPGTDPEAYFKQFEFDTHPGNDVRLNAWKNLGQKVSLAKSAGHEVRFSGRRVYPYKFLLKHYPIRSQSHGERKVLVERQARWEPAARAAGWHRQYDQIVKTTNFLRRSSDLDLFEEHYFNSFYLVERLAGTGLSANPAGMKRRDAWLTGLHNVTRDILAVIPMSDIFLLVDEDQLRSKLPGSLRPVPFLERNGEYWGPPADDGTAIREIERLRRAGSKFVAFAWPAFWWLDFYSGFHRYLCSKYRCVLENDRLVVFDLRTVTGRDSTG